MSEKILVLGEKVAVYEDGDRVVCTIQELYGDDPNIVKVNAGDDWTWKYKVVHVNQIRKFKKDITKSIYVLEPRQLINDQRWVDGKTTSVHITRSDAQQGPEWVKYVRVGK